MYVNCIFSQIPCKFWGTLQGFYSFPENFETIKFARKLAQLLPISFMHKNDMDLWMRFDSEIIFLNDNLESHTKREVAMVY